MPQNAPVIGMLRWDGSGRSLSQLEVLPGNSTNPETFAFPILYARVKGANFKTVVRCPSSAVLRASIRAAQEL